MECDQCGARRPRTGRCPNCGAPPPGGSSLSQWKGATRGSSARWDDDDRPASRGRGRGDYDEVDLERALVPQMNQMAPMAQGGMPMVPGMPTTEEEERALGIRRPVYIPVTEDKPRRKFGTLRIISGVLSIMLVCVASCGGAAFFGKDKINAFLPHPVRSQLTPQVHDYTLVPATPVSTPGAQAKYVVGVVTARSLDSNNVPIDVTTHFPVNVFVNLLVQISNVPAGEKHTVSVRWFLDDQDTQVDLQPGKKTSLEITQQQSESHKALFKLAYPTPGVGMARIYLDKPASDRTYDSNDPHLGQTIRFAIEQPTPTPSSKGSPAPTQSPSGTQTPQANVAGGGEMARWRTAP